MISSGEIAARAFARLDAGGGPADLVLELKIAPLTAQTLSRAWRQMRGALVVPAGVLEQIAALGLEGEWPPSSPEVLLENLKEIAAAAEPCESCRVGNRRYCRACVERVVRDRVNAVERALAGQSKPSRKHAPTAKTKTSLPSVDPEDHR